MHIGKFEEGFLEEVRSLLRSKDEKQQKGRQRRVEVIQAEGADVKT